MKIPTIHLNGTAKVDLMEALNEAHAALDAALSALGKTCPNGRDYYVQEPGAIYVAQDEYLSRLRRLEDVQQEIEQLRDAIDRQ